MLDLGVTARMTTEEDGKVEEGGGRAKVGAGGDFRESLKKRLAEKRSQLGATEESIKKYTAPPMQQGGEVRGAGVARFHNRLGPPPGVAQQGGGRGRGGPYRGGGLGARLGPRVSEGGGRRVIMEEDGAARGRAGGLLSRVVVEQKTREEVMAEKKASENEEVNKVNSNGKKRGQISDK